MPAARNRVVVPALLLLVVAVVIAALLVGRAGNPDETSPAPQNEVSVTTEGPGETRAAPPTPGMRDAPSTDGSAPDDAAAPDLTRRVEGDPMAAGPVDAPVGIVVYSDYSCPYCRQWAQETQPTVLEYAEAGAVRLEWRDVSILGEDSTRAAIAAAAAAEQGRYQDFHERLFADMGARSPEQLEAIAADLGLDVAQFGADVTDPAVLATVQRNIDESQAVGLSSTPSFVVGDTPVIGAQPAEVFVQLIERQLAERG